MENALKNIALKYNCDFHQFDGTYNLGVDIRNLPTKNIRFTKEENDFKLKATFMFLWGLSTKPKFSSGSFSDRFNFSLKCELNSSNLSNFHIMESGFFSQIFFNKTFKLSCKDNDLKRLLLENKHINSIFNFSKKSSDFSQIIESKTKNNLTSININFQSDELVPDIIEKCIEFCNDLRKLR